MFSSQNCSLTPDSKSGFIFFFSKRAKGKGQKQTRAREEMKVI
ncbi:hypothetical protein HMPREF3038_01470 [Akkermansia sp. KLE1797]|nr:hypothetical protein HMPREF3038_01470 [Akkermansia sp. KLE1797]KZA03429.1 hypothetical protein HMPREF1326_02858 [Akkermansia sp. KLE1605]